MDLTKSRRRTVQPPSMLRQAHNKNDIGVGVVLSRTTSSFARRQTVRLIVNIITESKVLR